MPDDTTAPEWPDWLENLTAEQRVRAIVGAVAACYSLGQRGHEVAEPGEQHCTAAMAGHFLLRLLDEARQQAPALSPEQMLREFHAVASLPLPGRPTAHPELGSQTGRAKILAEEVRELGDAIEAGDITEIADACADVVYAVVGTAVTYGIPFDAVLAEVHRSNMTKLIPPVEVNGDGKIVKGPGYEPPDIARAFGEAPRPAPVPSAADAQLALAVAALQHLAHNRVMADLVGLAVIDLAGCELRVRMDCAAEALETIARLGEPGAEARPDAAQSAPETTEGPSAPHGGGAPAQSVSVALSATQPLPVGDYGRAELPGMRSHTGWWTPGVLAGQSVMVCTDRDGNVVAEYILGPACRFVRLLVPVVTASADDDDPWRPAITAPADPDDDPDDYAAHRPACHDPECDGECTEGPPF